MLSLHTRSCNRTCSARTQKLFVAAPRSRPVRPVTVCVRAAFDPPPVSVTKAKFLENYKKPVASIYNTVIQELLVQQHFVRYSINYEYNEVFALGVVSMFEQVLESLPSEERSEIFNAYVRSIGEDPDAYRQDSAALESAAGKMSTTEELKPNAEGSDVQQVLAKVAAKVATGKFSYSKFFAIGLFRLLEIKGATEPSALEALVKGVGVKQEAVSRDLTLYKGILSKLSVAKELMKDFLEREKKKQAEREEEKAARAAKEAAAQQQPASVASQS